MSDLATPPRVVVVTDETTLADLAETPAILNAEAKAMSRRGKCGTETAEYQRRHLLIDSVLDDYEAKANARPS